MGETSTTPKSFLFVGSYTNYDILPHLPHGEKQGEGIYTFSWLDGKLEFQHVTQVENPAYLKYHPFHNVLYAVTECINRDGYITAFKVNTETGELSRMGSLAMTGKSSCSFSINPDGTAAIVANYWDGKLDVVELNSEGCPVKVIQEFQETNRENWRQVEDRKDHLSNRQVGPHAHCCIFHPKFKHCVFVSDLGDNCIYQYTFYNNTLKLIGYVPFEEGLGPRHIVLHPTLPIGYTSCELRNHIQVFGIDDKLASEDKMCLSAIQTISSLPEDFKGKASLGEIRLDKNGKYLYASNRGHDSIVVYEINQENGTLKTVQFAPTGKIPRHFGESPCKKYLVVAGQDSCCLDVFKILDNGTLENTQQKVKVPSPNYILFHANKQ